MSTTEPARKYSRINNNITPLLIVCLAGLLAWLSVRYQIQVDWTQSGRHTLSQASQDLLEQVEGNVEVTAYVRSASVGLHRHIKQLVKRYQLFKPEFKLHFINPDVVPDQIRELGINVHGEILLRYKGRTEHVKKINEESFTNALERLIRGADQWLAFIEGHGERRPLGKANHDLGVWAEKLVARGFKLRPLDLSSIKDVPDNTKILIIASPQINFLAGEVELISRYISRGGHLLWLIEPGDLKGLQSLARQLGIEISAGMIIDTASRLIGIEDPTIVLNTPGLYPPHPITRDFNYTTLFPRAITISIRDGTDWQHRPLLTSADHTWRETGALQGLIQYDAEHDELGPFNMGISLERQAPDTVVPDIVADGHDRMQRLIVIGDGDFLSNAYVSNSGNLDFGIRIINWLSDSEDLIDIPPRVADDRHLELPLWASAVIGFGFTLVLPLIFLSTGMFIWWRRRRQ